MTTVVPRASATRTAVVLAIVLPAIAVGLVGGVSVLICLPYAVVGGLLAIRRPGNVISWLLIALAWCFAFFGFPAQGSSADFLAGRVGGSAMALTVVQAATGQLLLTLLFGVCVLFPNGRLPRGRSGVAAKLGLGIMIVFAVQAVIAPTINASVSDPNIDQGIDIANPLALLPGLPVWVLTGVALELALALNVAAVPSLLVRLRHAAGIEAAQLRWLVWSVTAIVAGLGIGIIGDTLFANGLNGAVWIPAELSFPLPPVAIGFAILRYRLFDIDRIVSRTIAYAIVIAILGLLFTSLIVASQELLTQVTGGGTVAVAASTLVAFGLAQPLTRRIRVAVDRRFDRARYDGERAVTALADELRDQVDLEELQSDVLRVLDQTLRPARRTLWLRSR